MNIASGIMIYLRTCSLRFWQLTFARCLIVFSCCYGCAPQNQTVEQPKVEIESKENLSQSVGFEELVTKYRSAPSLQAIAAVRAASSRRGPNEEQRLARQLLWSRIYFLALARDVKNRDLPALKSALLIERQSILEMAAHYNYEREKMRDIFGKMQDELRSEFRYFEALDNKGQK